MPKLYLNKYLRTESKIVDLISHLFFGLLILLSILYREERLLSDASYYFFRVVNNESFWIEHDRYILIFSQIAPWIGSNVGLELSTIILLSSLGHVLFFYSIYLITRYVYKDIYAGITLLSIQLLGITTGFFVPIFELYYAMGLLVLFHVIFYSGKNKLRHIVLVVLAFFIITAHFYAILLFIYMLLLYAFEKRDFSLKKYLPYALLIAIFIVFKSFIISDYEKAKSANFLYGLSHNTYDLEYLKSWFSFILKNYWDWSFLVLSTLAIMIAKKRYLISLGYFIFLIGLIIMVNISAYGFELSRYKEQVYFSLMFLTGSTFVYTLTIVTNKKLIYVLFALITIVFSYRYKNIIESGKQFEDRLSEMKKIIDETQHMKGTKFVIDQKDLIHDPNWSYPIESVLYSAVHNKKCVSIVTSDDISFSDNHKKLRPSDYLFRRWEIYDLSRLNPEYFSLDNSIYIEIGKQIDP